MQICKKNGGERMADSRSTYLKCKEEKKKERKMKKKWKFGELERERLLHVASLATCVWEIRQRWQLSTLNWCCNKSWVGKRLFGRWPLDECRVSAELGRQRSGQGPAPTSTFSVRASSPSSQATCKLLFPPNYCCINWLNFFFSSWGWWGWSILRWQIVNNWGILFDATLADVGTF